MECKVINVPGLEDGRVGMAKCLSKRRESNPIQDHAPNAALHDTLVAEEDGQFSVGAAM